MEMYRISEKTTREAAQSPPGVRERRASGRLSPGKGVEQISEFEVVQRRSKRGHWGSKSEFLLACIGWSVGIGNVWRFPYLAYSNGGGAFLIPYLVMLILAGKPMYFMELLFGQFVGLGSLTVWSCAPIAKGVGYAMVTLSLIVAVYYNVIMSYTLFYMFASMQATLPWTKCGQEWNSVNCVVRRQPLPSCISNWTLANPEEACICPVNASTPALLLSNCSCTGNASVDTFYLNCVNTSLAGKPVSASEEYWTRYVLDLSPRIEDIGELRWSLTLCLLLSWIVVFLCLVKGVRSAGKVVYFTATFPYVILLVLLVRGVTLDGAREGVLYFITPTWEKLLDVNVWKDAAGQMFFSLGVAWGGLIMFGSYNKFSNNVYNDALLISIVDTLTSLLAGFVIFSVLGAMAKELNIPIDQVAAEGHGLAFVAYPEALARLPAPQLWSVLFFFMLFILGLDSEFALLENVLTAISDEYPNNFRGKRTLLCAIACVVCFLLGLPCITRGGQYVLNLMDTYGGGFTVMFVAICECAAINWIYGVKRFADDALFMLGFRPGLYWIIAWAVLAPITLAVIFVYSLVVFEPLSYGSYNYPNWAEGIGWAIALFVMVQIPVWACISIYQQKGTLSQRLRSARLPAAEWGPSDPVARKKYASRDYHRVTFRSVHLGKAMFSENIDEF